MPAKSYFVGAVVGVAVAWIMPVNAQSVPRFDPENRGGWVLNEAVSDEFNGIALDPAKWNTLGFDGNDYGEWKGRAPSQYDPANVRVGDGHLTITSRWDPEFAFSDSACSNGFRYGKPAPVTTAAVVSKAKFKYGYLEMRCQAAAGPVSSAFWTTGVGGEIDVFEHYGENPANPYSAGRFHASFHDWRKGSASFGKRVWTHEHQLDFKVADGFHVYGFEWDVNFVKMHVDGRLVRCATKKELGDKWVASNEQKVWIDSETFEWEQKASNLTESDFGGGRHFVVDYCRVWNRSGESSDCVSRTNLLTNPGFEAGLQAWTGTAAVSDDVHSGRSAAALEAGGVMEQTVSVKPGTTYILSGWARSPETNEADRWFNAYLGVKGHGIEDANTRFFFPTYHAKSLQFTTGPTATTAVVYFTNRPHAKRAVIDDIELVEAPAAISR